MILRDTLVFRTLLAIARQRADYDETRCHALLGLLAAADSIRSTARQELHRLALSEHQFSSLVVLRALDPEPALPTTIASHTDTSRAAMTDIIDTLLARGVVERRRSKEDRRNYLISLTDAGRALADRAETVLLQTVTQLSQRLRDTEPQLLVGACQRLTTHFRESTAPESTPSTQNV